MKAYYHYLVEVALTIQGDELIKESALNEIVRYAILYMSESSKSDFVPYFSRNGKNANSTFASYFFTALSYKIGEN